MRIIGVALAIVLLGGIVFGVGYGAYTGYEFLTVQWGSLSNDWKAILIVVAALLAVCTLFLSVSVQSSVRRYGLKGTGKVMAYNDFVHWYSAMKCDTAEAMSIEAVKPLVNQMILWGNYHVGRQAHHLHELFQQEKIDKDAVIQRAESIYIDIRRDLGLRGNAGEHPVL